MSRISIDVTPEEHQRLKALAALQGKSIKEFVLERTIGTSDDADALRELETMLDARIANAEAGNVSNRSVKEIFRQARHEAGDDG